jgi:tetratricopeptide (TPR) repeat protein
MKKIITLATIMFMYLLSGCSENVLNITPEGTPTPGNFWKTADDAILAANSMYEQFTQQEFYGRGLMWMINASDDMVVGRIKAEAQNIKNFNGAMATGSYMRDQWKFRYKVIKRANDIIRNVPNIKDPKLTDKLRNRILGEAYFLSGAMYYELAYNYGDERAGVPIADRDNPLNYYISRTKNVRENYDYLIKDLEKAAELLPYFDEYTPADYGRAHKTVAWAYLAKTYLIMKDYVNAEKYATMVINSGKHALVPEFKDVFIIANNWSKEYIWSVVSNVQSGSILPGVMLENKGWGKYNGWGYYQPTKELYDAYETGDKRREATILKTGDEFFFFGEKKIYSSTNSLTGYQFNKYMEPFTYKDPIGKTINPDGDNPSTMLNVPLMRYAEVLLINAEAKLMQGKNADAEINQIRSRAGLPAITGSTMTNLKKERRCELAGEYSNRHFDLVRWGDAQSTYSKPLHGMNGQEVWPARSFNPSIHHVWAIPQSEIDNSAGLILQNQGW